MSENLISIVNPGKDGHLPKEKITQDDLVYLGLVKAKSTHPKGITPTELSNVLNIPAPSVRKFLAKYVNYGLAERETIRPNLVYYKMI